MRIGVTLSMANFLAMVASPRVRSVRACLGQRTGRLVLTQLATARCQGDPEQRRPQLAAGRTWRALPANLRLAADVHRERLTRDCLAAAALTAWAISVGIRAVEQREGCAVAGLPGLLSHGGSVCRSVYPRVYPERVNPLNALLVSDVAQANKQDSRRGHVSSLTSRAAAQQLQGLLRYRLRDPETRSRLPRQFPCRSPERATVRAFRSVRAVSVPTPRAWPTP